MSAMQLEIGECFESISDALRAAVVALGGYKKLGPTLRPELPIAQAEAWLRHCLDDSRREKLSPDQLQLILREARRAGFHSLIDFMASDAGYNKPQPAELEKQVQDLQGTIAQQLERLNANMATLAKLQQRAVSQ